MYGFTCNGKRNRVKVNLYLQRETERERTSERACEQAREREREKVSVRLVGSTRCKNTIDANTVNYDLYYGTYEIDISILISGK